MFLCCAKVTVTIQMHDVACAKLLNILDLQSMNILHLHSLDLHCEHCILDLLVYIIGFHSQITGGKSGAWASDKCRCGGKANVGIMGSMQNFLVWESSGVFLWPFCYAYAGFVHSL